MKPLFNRLFRRPRVLNQPGQVATLTWDPAGENLTLEGWHIDAAGGSVSSALVAIARLLNDLAAEAHKKGLPVEVEFGEGVRINGEVQRSGAYRVRP